MVNDIRRRAPYYVSDWLDAWDYRVVPATVFMYFAKYALDDPLTFFTLCHAQWIVLRQTSNHLHIIHGHLLTRLCH